MEGEHPDWHPARQCTATNRQGERCRRQPIAGGAICTMHGGRAPQILAAAKLRLLEAVEPAIARLLRFIESPPGLCHVCGRSDDTSAIVSAIKAVLDRSGLGPSASLTVTAAPTDETAQTTEELLRRAEMLVGALREQLADEAAPQLPARSDEGTVEGVVVTDGDDERI
jgi:hypothetical protein